MGDGKPQEKAMNCEVGQRDRDFLVVARPRVCVRVLEWLGGDELLQEGSQELRKLTRGFCENI